MSNRGKWRCPLLFGGLLAAAAVVLTLCTSLGRGWLHGYPPAVDPQLASRMSSKWKEQRPPRYRMLVLFENYPVSSGSPDFIELIVSGKGVERFTLLGPARRMTEASHFVSWPPENYLPESVLAGIVEGAQRKRSWIASMFPNSELRVSFDDKYGFVREVQYWERHGTKWEREGYRYEVVFFEELQ